MYATDALALSWGCLKTKLRRKNEKGDIPTVSDEILGTQSCEFRRTGSLQVTGTSSVYPFGYVLVAFRLLGVVLGTHLGVHGRATYDQVRFVFLSFILFTFPFLLHHMSSGSQAVGDAVVPKFDMHVYTSVLTSDEVKSLVAEYAIPLDLLPCVPPSGLTMNRLPADKIVATSMSQFLKFSMAGGVRIPEKSDHQKVVEYENERVLAAKRKAQAAKDRAVRKRAATEGASQRTKKKKTTPLSFALSDSKADGSNRSGSGTHHSASSLNTIIPNEAELTTGGDGLILEPVNRAEEDTEHHLDNVEDTTIVNSLLFGHSPRSQHSNPSNEDAHNMRDETAHTHASISTSRLSSSSGGSHRQAFTRRNPGGSSIGSSLRSDMDLSATFVPVWNLTTQSILNDVESYRDMMINLATPSVLDQQNRLSDYQALQRSWFELGRGALAQIDILRRYEALNEDYEELYESHRSCQGVFDRLTDTQNQLLDVVRSRNQLSKDHKALQQVHLGCVGKETDLTEKLVAVEKEMDDLLDKDREREERIKQLEANLASKTSSLAETEGVVNTLKGDLERLTMDLGQAEIVRHNYVRQLLPTVFQRLLSSACSEEEAEAFLATVVDYDPACKDTFMSEFDSLFNKSYPYVEKLVESFRLPLGDLQNMWPEGDTRKIYNILCNTMGNLPIYP
ncbi:hypothetical protein Tco_0314075 [Tanacetum coccineum]